MHCTYGGALTYCGSTLPQEALPCLLHDRCGGGYQELCGTEWVLTIENSHLPIAER